MAVRYSIPDGVPPEKERARIVQNLAVVAHELYFRDQIGNEACADQIAEAVRFIDWLYERAFKGEENKGQKEV